MVRRTPDEHARAVELYWGSQAAAADDPPDNIAVLPHMSGLLVVDFDGAEVRDRWGGLLAGAETLTEVSGRKDGGWHLFYSFTAPYPEFRLRQTIPRTPVEIKHRSLVLVTPSLHRSGRRYRWLDPSVPVAPAPEILTRPAAERTFEVGGRIVGEDVCDDIRMSRELTGLAVELLGLDLASVEQLAGMRRADGGRPTRAHALAYHLAAWTVGGILAPRQVIEMLLAASESNGACRDYGSADIERQIRNGLAAGTAAAGAARRKSA
jgi:hypothetical protein